MQTPIYTKLKEYAQKNRISFAMPGHKNGRGLAEDYEKCDVTELDATLDLQEESAEVRSANALLGKLYGSKASFILTCGSTAGVQVMLSSVLMPGDLLLAAADCHLSVINTCAVCGFKIKLLPVRYNLEYGVPEGLDDFEIPPQAKAVLVTSPNYYGVVKDIDKISKKCRMAGVPLLVDEAHGAHFIKQGFPKTAVGLADIVCHSAHKTLNALTGAAYLHISGDTVNIDRVRKAIRVFETSSPSYPIAASADAARAALAAADYTCIMERCRDFLNFAGRELRIKVFKNDDITRMVLNFSPYEISGFDVCDILSERYGIDIEMADLKNIVLIATPYNSGEDFRQLMRALSDIVKCAKISAGTRNVLPPPAANAVVSPSAGWYAETESVPVDSAAGRTAANVAAAYPPGTSIIVTGETIRQESIDYIQEISRAGARLVGIKNNKIEVVKWID